MGKEKLSERELQILEVAKVVFAEQGFHKATVDEIASRAGVAKGTVYLYFKSKDELFLKTLEFVFNEMMESVQVPEEIQDPLERLKIGIRRYLEYLEEHKRLFGIILHDRVSSVRIPARSQERKLEIYKALEQRIIALMKKCIEAGYLKPINPLWLASAITGIISRFVVNSLVFSPNQKLTDLYPLILEIFLNGAKAKQNS